MKKILIIGISLAVNGIAAVAQTYLMSNSDIYTTCSGNFYDGGGPTGNYNNTTSPIIITFYPADTINQKLSVTFSSFETDPNDVLKVYNGNSTTSTQIASLSGNIAPGTIISTASNGSLTFKFQSFFVGGVGAVGWAASISCVAAWSMPLSNNVTMMSSGTYRTCSGNFYDDGGPSGNYNRATTPIIVTFYPADTINQKLSVTFSSFVTDASDYLTVFNGSSTAATQIANLSGTVAPGTIISTASNGSLTFRFQYFCCGGTGAVAAGWAASISCVAAWSMPLSNNVTMMSSGTYRTCSGNFYDDGGPSANYNRATTPIIVTFYPADTINQKLSVTFSSFTTDASDYLTVYNGSSTAETQIANLSGTVAPGTIISTASNGSLTFRFQYFCCGGTGAVAAGWAASISCVAAWSMPLSNNVTMMSSGTYRTCSGNFYDDGGPSGNYNRATTPIIVTFYPADTINQKLSVTFSSFVTDASDYLTVFNGSSTAATQIANLSGTVAPGTIISTASNGSLTFRFQYFCCGGTGAVAAGWAASISCVAAWSMPLSNNVTMMSSGTYRTCSGNFYDDGGPSGNYNRATTPIIVTFYPDDTINQKLSVTFSSFTTDASDYLTVYNGSSIAATHLIDLHGTMAPDPIISTASNGSLTFKFQYFCCSGTGAVAAGWAATVSCTGGSTTVIYPKLYLSASSINPGQSITITGTDFRYNGGANISIIGTSGFSQSVNNVSTNAQSGFVYNYATSTSMPLGLYNVQATDTISGLTTPLRSFNLAGTSVTNYLQIVYPTIGLSFGTNQNINIEWKDKLVLGNNYTVVGSKRNYKYTVEYSDNGGPWQNIGTVQGQDYINSYVYLSKGFSYSTISNNMMVRITDFYNSSNVKTSPAFSIVSATSTNLQVNLEWDFSYPARTAPLQGIAADGTARIFMNLSKIFPTGPNIASVSVALSDAYNGSDATRIGRVKVANQTTSYNSEANGITTITATDNTANKSNYIFWYVAPDDFVGNDIQDSTNSFRYVNAFFTVTYTNSSIATFTKKIKIVRPPLMLVHGLGGDASTWDDFAHTDYGSAKKFIEDYRFVISKAVNINPTAAFKENALNMTIGFSNPNPNTFQGVIIDIRNQGYAANRVDYVCHSMGGSVLRSIYDNWYPQFTRTGIASSRPFKNYERGYVNKVIMLDVPNNSSPWADIINRYVDDLPCGIRILMQSWYAYSGQQMPIPLMFIKPVDPSSGNWCASYIPPFIVKPWVYEPTDAVRNLQIDYAQGGINFGATNTKAHLIAGDIFPGTQYNTNGLIPQQIINFVNNIGDDILETFLNELLEIAYIKEVDPVKKAAFLYIIEHSENPVAKALDFLNYMSAVMDAFNLGTFIPESDLIVSVQSQLAGHSKTDPNCSSFEKVGHTLIKPVTKNIDVGNRVSYLLNSSINSSLFDAIGPTTNRIGNSNSRTNRHTNTLISSRIDSTKLKITSPENNASIYLDSFFHIRINVMDTTNLLSLKVNFQNKSYTIDSIFLGTIDMNIQVNTNILDTQLIVLQGFYNYPDSGVFIYDFIQINNITNGTLLNFGVSPDILYLFKGEYKYPDYFAIYNNFVATRGKFSPFISVIVNDTSIVKYDSLARGFKGISVGETYAIISYLGLSDTIYFVVDRCMSGTNSTIISANGNTIFCAPNSISLSAEPGMTEYLWNTGSTTPTINVNTTGDYSVIIVDSSGCSASSQIITVIVNPLPAQPDSISGNIAICQGTIQTYYIDTVASATSYTWILPSGWTGISTTDTIHVIVGSNNGTISVKANTNSCSGPAQTLAVTVNTVPLQPEQINGISFICKDSIQTYSINPIVNATAYTWSLPSGWTGNSTTNSILATAGPNSGTISVKAINSCGISAERTLAVTVNQIPAQPNAITGSNAICKDSIQTYSVAPVTNAASYSWTLPSGWTGSSITNTIQITAGPNSDTIKVKANNSCGSSTNQFLPVTVNQVPAQPGTITGNTTVCQGTTQTYLVTAVPNAISYTWTLPSGWTGSSTTNSIQVTVGPNSDTIKVRAINSCGSSIQQKLAITVNPLPAQPTAITGNNNAILTQTSPYSISTLANATGYNWQLSGGGTIQSGQNSTSITTYWTTVGNYNLSVNGVGVCGNGPSKTLDITVTYGVTGVVNPNNQYQIKVIPNPSSGEFYLTAKGLINKRIKIDILNNLGQSIYKADQQVLSNDFNKLIDLKRMADGVYYIRLIIENKTYMRKIVKAG